jgi:hypothetical protein
VFDRHGDTLDVLNKTFRIAPADASRACRALFRAFPEVRRIHLEVMTPASREAARLSVFRSQWARAWSPDEAAATGYRRARLAAHTSYWMARHAAGGALRGLSQGARSAGKR